jgi:dihydropteroate synthase
LARPETWPRRPLLAGILNVTPDSFSDGGHHERWEDAVAHGLALAANGADIIDVGGESTRPGAAAVDLETELERVVPVIRVLAGETQAALSIDTRRPDVARAALEAGARWVNDISGLNDPAMGNVIAKHGAGVVLMHMRGEPATMQSDVHYEDVLEEVSSFLQNAATRAQQAGIPRERIWLDPGIGFGKELEHNLILLQSLDQLARLGYPVMVGASRKSFIGQLSGDAVDERIGGSLAAIDGALRLRHCVLRVHDVAATRQYLQVRRSIEGGVPRDWPRNDGVN